MTTTANTGALFTRAFWVAAVERAAKAGAWSLAATLAAGQAGVLAADWPQALSVAGMAVVLSILGSVSSDMVTGGGPSLTNAERLTMRPASGRGLPRV